MPSSKAASRGRSKEDHEIDGMRTLTNDSKASSARKRKRIAGRMCGDHKSSSRPKEN
jgi:hypothetical protein